jgi:hypothetical protein
MAEITINIPDPIHNKIKKRAEQTGNNEIGVIIANLALTFGVSSYDDSKWIKNLKGQDDASKPW